MMASEYLKNNQILAFQLIGQQIKSLTRLSYLKPQDEIRLESGPLILETYNKFRLYMDVDEGQANILLFDANYSQQNINENINRYPYKNLIVPDKKPQNNVGSLLSKIISNIEIISRSDEDFGFSSMCGFKLIFNERHFLNIGAYLTNAKIPDIWILNPDEVDIKNLSYQPLVEQVESSNKFSD